MKLLVGIARVAKMPLDDVARLSVSNWIRSMLYYEHRKINANRKLGNKIIFNLLFKSES